MPGLPGENVIENVGSLYAGAAALMILKENVGEERSEDVLAIIIASRAVAPLHILPDDAEKVDTLVAVENLDEYYPLSRDFETTSETFILNVKGDSMKEIGIYSGDKVIIRKQDTAENGELIAALVNDSATVKRFFKRDGKFILHPENSAYDDIIVDELIVLGKVIGLIRKYR